MKKTKKINEMRNKIMATEKQTAKDIEKDIILQFLEECDIENLIVSLQMINTYISAEKLRNRRKGA